MTYTFAHMRGGMHVTRVDPLDPNIVRFVLTLKIADYPTNSDELLSLYAALALTKTKTKTKEKIETYLKLHGISLKISSSRASISFKGSVRKDNVSEAVKLLKEIITELSIDSTEFVLKKKLALEDNREARDDAKRIAHIAFSNLLYDRASIMRAVHLDEELSNIKKIQKKDLEIFVDMLPQSSGKLTVVCAEETETLFNPLLKVFKSKVKVPSYIVREVRVREPQSMFLTVPGKTNVEVRIGNIIPITPDHNDFIPLQFGLTVLGKVGGFSGRLMSTVREKEGLTYGIYARIIESLRTNTIHWNIYTFFSAKDLEKGIAATLRELSLIVEKGITKAELVTFKEIIRNQIILNHESNATRLSYYHELSLMGYSEAESVVATQHLLKLTVEEVNAALKKYLDPEKLIIVGAGPVTSEGNGITTS